MIFFSSLNFHVSISNQALDGCTNLSILKKSITSIKHVTSALTKKMLHKVKAHISVLQDQTCWKKGVENKVKYIHFIHSISTEDEICKHVELKSNTDLLALLLFISAILFFKINSNQLNFFTQLTGKLFEVICLLFFSFSLLVHFFLFVVLHGNFYLTSTICISFFLLFYFYLPPLTLLVSLAYYLRLHQAQPRCVCGCAFAFHFLVQRTKQKKIT